MRWFGEYDTKKRLIRINAKKSKNSGAKGELLDTIAHELNHAKHPRWGERKTERETARYTKKLSKKSKNRLYSLLK